MKRVIGSLSIAGMLFLSTSAFAADSVEYSADLTDGLPSTAFKASSQYSDFHKVQKAFNNVWNEYNSSFFTPSGKYTNQWVQVDFNEPKSIAKLNYQADSFNNSGVKNFKVQSSSDGVTWVDQYVGVAAQNYKVQSFTWEPSGSYRYWRMFLVNGYGTQYLAASEIEMMEKITPVTTAPTLDIQAPQTTIAGGAEFTTYAIVKNAKDLYAEDVRVKYDTNLFEFVKAEPANNGLHIYHEKQEAPGDLRFIVASNGEQYGINGEAQLLKLTFKAKNVPGKGKIDISAGLVADSKGTEVEATVDGEEITVTGGFDADVNGDGKYSLGDVAIAGFHHSKDKANWTNPKSDVDKNDKVEDSDLSLIVQKILNP